MCSEATNLFAKATNSQRKELTRGEMLGLES